MITKILEDKCNGCGWCPISCRMDLLHMDRKRKKAFFTNPERCVTCFFCQRTCPQDAIIVGSEKPVPYPQPLIPAQLQGDIATLSRGKVSHQETCDVIVVGAGVAGLTAAIAAATSGAKTIVLEKAANIAWTNTSLSGGSISFAKEREMYPDAKRLSAEEKVQQAIELTNGHVNTELIRAWRLNIDGTLTWLKKLGLKAGTEGSVPVPSAAAFNARGCGAGLNKQLLSIATKVGVKVVYDARAVELLTDKQHKVVGLRAMTLNGLIDYVGHGVVLAAAGFQANREMVTKYLGSDFAENVKLTGSPYSVGDGHILARDVGAKFINMESFHCRQIDKSWVPGSQGHFGPRQLQPLQHYGIFVNILGKRFMDEYGPAVRSDTVSCTIIRQPEGAVAYLWDATVSAMMGKKLDNYRPEGVVFQANTLEEIAKVIGCPLAELRKTVETFNKAASEGKTANLDVPKSDFVYPLEKPPFTGIFPVWSGHNATFGGPAINGNAEVLDVKDNPIPGLYAAGETAGGFFYGHYSTTPGGATSYQGNYQVTSSALGYCIVFGHIAGSNAVRELS